MGKKIDCLYSIFLNKFNAVLILSSVAIITLLLVPVKFEPMKLRYNSNGQAPSSDSLALAMTVVQFRNYFSNVPDVHMNISNDQMTDFWFLPRGTRLSPLMQSIARCRMAADVKSVDDPEVCNRVPIGLMLLAMIVAMINLVDIVWRGYTKRVVKNDDANTLHAFFHVITWNVLLVVMCFVCAFVPTNHIDMVYTLPGELYPQPYYAFPNFWLCALLLWLPIFKVKSIECIGFCDVIASAK